MATLQLVGTWFRPELHLRTSWGEKLPAQPTRTVNDWVKKAPGRTWDPDQECWIIDSLGKFPERALAKVGLEVDTSGFEGEVFSLDDLVAPAARVDKDRPGYAKIAPRLSGRFPLMEALGPAAIWDKKHGRISIPVLELADTSGNPRRDVGIDYPANLHEQIVRAAATAGQGGGKAAERHVTVAALAHDLKTASSQRALKELENELGNLDGFGVNLFEYQHLGAYAVASGRSLLCDQPGLGKTLQALAALTLTASERIVLVVPPVVLTNWRREYLRAGTLPPQTVIFTPGRKEPALPAAGAVIVSDSLLAARPQLLADLIEWGPDGLVYDEAHRAKTWEAARSVAVRTLAESLGSKPRIALTGTPQTKSPSEIASMLAVTGQLNDVFGGYGNFVAEFCRQDRFGNLLPRKKELPRLRAILDQEVWVRRYKADVATDLPPKQWHTIDVDVSLKEFRAAHADSLETVTEWVEQFVARHGREPNDADVDEYAQNNLGIISPMRKAAGVAKVEPAADWILGWLEARQSADDGNVADDGGVASPLLVWCHHHDVMGPLRDILTAELGVEVPVISGNTSMEEKTRMVDGFQAGDFPVMICQITAAGVGITLTRSADAVFVETDWTDALIQQAEDRIHRWGATGDKVTYTTLLAVGTLDEFIHKVRLAKKDIADVVVGRAEREAADDTQRGRDLLSPSDMIVDLVDQVLRNRAKVPRRKKRALRAA